MDEVVERLEAGLEDRHDVEVLHTQRVGHLGGPLAHERHQPAQDVDGIICSHFFPLGIARGAVPHVGEVLRRVVALEPWLTDHDDPRGMALRPANELRELLLEQTEHRRRVRDGGADLLRPGSHGTSPPHPSTRRLVTLHGAEPSLAKPLEQLDHGELAGLPAERALRMAREDVARWDRVALDGRRRAFRQPIGDVVAPHHDDDEVEPAISRQDPPENHVETLRRDPGQPDVPDVHDRRPERSEMFRRLE